MRIQGLIRLRTAWAVLGLATGLSLAGGTAEAQQVRGSSNGAQEVHFNSGCIVYFNRRGQRTHSRYGCTNRQVQRAEDAIADARLDEGGRRPEVLVRRNGKGEVVFRRNNCIVYYDRRGHRDGREPNCSERQLSRADAAIAKYRRDNGLSTGSNQLTGPSRDVRIFQDGSGRVSFRNGCVVNYNRNGSRRDASHNCNRRYQGWADEAMTARRAELGLHAGRSGTARPQVYFNDNGSGEVGFRNGCFVSYNRHGERKGSSAECTASQKRRADEEFARNRRSARQQRDATGTTGGLLGRPTVQLQKNGPGMVRYGDGCTVRYDRRGVRGAVSGHCSQAQLRNADSAMTKRRAALGIDCQNDPSSCQGGNSNK